MGSRGKRASYRRPDVAGAPRKEPALPDPGPSRRAPQRGAWWPLAAAAGLTFVLVLLVVLANLDSPPIPSAP